MALNSISPAVQNDYRRALLAQESPSFLDSTLPIQPVVDVRRGVPIPSSNQSVKSFAIVKALVATTQTQVATVAANTRVFFLGVQTLGSGSFSGTDVFYVEDADTGVLSPSDNSTIPLYYYDAAAQNGDAAPFILPYPRECKRGIRVHLEKATTAATKIVVWWVEVRTDGQHEAI